MKIVVVGFSNDNKGGRLKCPYSMNTPEKLVFIASFMWMMQWGTRVTFITINALF